MRQRENAGLYVRGLIEQGARKSLQPTLFRLEEGSARYESVQQFLADSPWDPALVVRSCAERVLAEIGVEAWVLDDTGFPKQGKGSPGVKRQYSGTLGKIGNCQIGVSVHAVGARGTAPLGWALYLPQEWCEDAPRRAKAKIPASVRSRRSPSSASSSCSGRAGWRVPRAPVLGDQPTATTPSCASARRGAAGVRARGRAGDEGVRARNRVCCPRASTGPGQTEEPADCPTASRSRSVS